MFTSRYLIWDKAYGVCPEKPVFWYHDPDQREIMIVGYRRKCMYNMGYL